MTAYPLCFGKNAQSVPDAELCVTCECLAECKEEFYTWWLKLVEEEK
jgi:hypothetical protein